MHIDILIEKWHFIAFFSILEYWQYNLFFDFYLEVMKYSLFTKNRQKIHIFISHSPVVDPCVKRLSATFQSKCRGNITWPHLVGWKYENGKKLFYEKLKYLLLHFWVREQLSQRMACPWQVHWTTVLDPKPKWHPLQKPEQCELKFYSHYLWSSHKYW